MEASKKLMLALAYTLILMIFLIPHAFAQSVHAKAEMKSNEMNSLADIAAIDTNEIVLASLASNKKASSDVMDFAHLMIEQHGSNLAQLLDLAHQVHLHSLSSAESNKLMAKGHQEMMKLGRLQGDQFAHAYINAMVEGHQEALNLIDNHLMKSAHSESIKKFLNDTREAVVQHLKHAKEVQENLKKMISMEK